MIKIMLVEDDKSLREIYGVRLLAEGYDIVSAGDGEEALAMAIKERPQLIISDVMMPKVSGYDMLDILRSTTETKNIRVIMMTALSSDEQRSRAESLGADRYLVKSQVGIEDVVRVVHEILGDTAQATPAAPAAAPQQPAVATAPVSQPQTPPPTVTPAPQPPATPPPSVVPPQPQAPAAAPQAPPVTPPPAPATQPVAPPQPPVAPVAPTTPPAAVVKPPEPPKPASLKSRVIQPLSDPNVSPIDINELLNKELAKEAGLTGSVITEIPSAAEEKALVEEKIEAFQPLDPTPVEAPAPIITAPTPESLMPTPGLTNSSPASGPTPPAADPSTPPAPTAQ